MSVAFRRESDDEHKEPVFEIPIPPGPNRVTARGLTLIEERLAAVEAAIAEAPDEERRGKLNRERRYWSTRKATAEPMPAPAPDIVAFGSRVEYRLGGKVHRVDIVGDDEADPAEGRIAFSAPLARAMMDAEPGEAVDFNGRAEAVEILSARAIPA